MVTLQFIEKRFLKKIKPSIKKEILTWINEPEPQKWINKALDYSITNEEAKLLYKIGKQRGKYPKLYWLCLIYIHPLTVVENFATTVSIANF